MTNRRAGTPVFGCVTYKVSVTLASLSVEKVVMNFSLEMIRRKKKREKLTLFHILQVEAIFQMLRCIASYINKLIEEEMMTRWGESREERAGETEERQ